MSSDWSLIIGHQLGPLGWAVLVLCVGAALSEAGLTLVRAHRGTTRTRRRSAWALLSLRLVAVAALVCVVLELGLRQQTWTGSARRVVVLLDRSASMDLADAPEGADPGSETTRRWDRLAALWSASADARASWREGERGEPGVDVEVRAFGSRTTPLTRDQADALAIEPDAAASDLTRALVELAEARQLAARGEGAPLAAVVVASDGLVVRGQAEAAHLEAVAADLDLPITTAALGAPTLRDLAISELHVGEFAFVENVTEFSAELVAHGFDGEQVIVELRRDGELVETQRAAVSGDSDRQTLRFEVAPDRTGQFVYEFRVRPAREDPPEASLANNRRAFVIKVLRDKVRVLHVAGRPDWDVRALRTLLKRDPNVELLSYYILRDWDDTLRDDGTAPMSLIAFPTEELFREQLGSFDLVIMHNFDAVSHDTYLGNVADYVEQGGSLVVIGGDMGLATGDYASAAIAKLMPVDTRELAGLQREPFAPRLAEAGVRHPITAWLGESGRADWRGLPALDSFNALPMAPHAASIGATTLLEHPSARAGGQPTPLLSVAEPGKGRVMVLATGATWRLGFAPDLPLIDGARPYDLLWLGAVRWLLRDASADRLVLEIGKREHAVGEAVDLSVRTVSASYAPEPEVEVHYEIRRLDQPDQPDQPEEASGEASGDPKADAREGALTTDALGRAATRLEGLGPGAYEAVATREGPGGEPAGAQEDDAPELGVAARRVFLIGGGGRELAEVDADPGTALLRALAEQSGGRFVDGPAGDTLPASLPMKPLDDLERPADGREDRPLWDGWLMVVIALGAFGGEWILRRRSGLL
ncbi:hypothetical protein G6O69_33880 [Pseudenhygromyxa sp. WMMC2535]|nr:hypothetical protein [Pseudenhygromyxa sp. WMMC2535]